MLIKTINIFLNNLLKFLPFIIVLTVSLFLYFYGSPQNIVSEVGIENAYLLMFVFAFLGGLTTFNTVPYYSMLFLLASGGVDPVFLGLASASGVMCGDTFSYFLGRQGSTAVPRKIAEYFLKIKEFAEKFPKAFLLTCLFYGSLSPLSNDFLTIPAGMAKVKYWKVMLPLSMGNIIFNITLAYLCVYSAGFVKTFFGI